MRHDNAAADLSEVCAAQSAVKGKIHLLEIIHISAFITGERNNAAETNLISVLRATRDPYQQKHLFDTVNTACWHSVCNTALPPHHIQLFLAGAGF